MSWCAVGRIGESAPNYLQPGLDIRYTPALVMLESSRPLSGLGGQTLRFVEPWFAAVTNAAGLKVLAELLERPGGMDFVVTTLQDTNKVHEAVAGGDRA